jgi:hypothetical protein
MPRIGLLVSCGLIWCALCAASARVRADVAPPGSQACVGKASGDACEGGVCRAQRCTKLDYASWDRDAEVAPPTVSYDCVLCVPGGGSGGGGAGGQNGGSTAPSTPGEDSGCGSCSTGGGDLGLRGAALGFALFMGLWLAGFARRTPR